MQPCLQLRWQASSRNLLHCRMASPTFLDKKSCLLRHCCGQREPNKPPRSRRTCPRSCKGNWRSKAVLQKQRRCFCDRISKLQRRSCRRSRARLWTRVHQEARNCRVSTRSLKSQSSKFKPWKRRCNEGSRCLKKPVHQHQLKRWLPGHRKRLYSGSLRLRRAVSVRSKAKQLRSKSSCRRSSAVLQTLPATSSNCRRRWRQSSAMLQTKQRKQSN
mmetsp:Transcript_7721/g.17991  ORF Transcript_7721/g.17991 Transcript_7721/m.17991 type:complete len:216 (-) Transcript_7721:628-1275(-)